MGISKKIEKNNRQMRDDLIKTIHELVAALWASDQALVALENGEKIPNLEAIKKLNQDIFEFFELEVHNKDEVTGKESEEKEDVEEDKS